MHESKQSYSSNQSHTITNQKSNTNIMIHSTDHKSTDLGVHVVGVCMWRAHLAKQNTSVVCDRRRETKRKRKTNGLPPPWALKAALVWIHRTTGAIGRAGGDCRSCGVCCIEGAQARSRILAAVPRHIVSPLFFFCFGCFFRASEMDYSRHRSSLPLYLPREKKERKKESHAPKNLHYTTTTD